MFPLRSHGCLTAALIAGVLLPVSARAEDTRAFFQKNVAVRWDQPVRANSSTSIEFDKQQKNIEQTAAALKQQPKQEPETAKPQEKPFYPEQPTDKDGIVAKYGDPADDKKIVPRGDAPPEFMGMAAAINAGDEQLAFDYARAYARRMKRLQDFVDRAAEYNSLAMEAEGFEDSPDTNSPSAQFSIERKALQDKIEQAREERLASIAKTKFDDKAEAMLKSGESEVAKARMARSPNDVPVSGNIPKSLTPPIDPEGRVRALVFFAPSSMPLEQFLTEMEDLAKRLKGTKNVDIRLLSTEPLTEIQLAAARETMDSRLKVQNGYALAEHFKVVKVPSVILVAETSKEIFPMEGTSDAGQIAEMIRYMQGGTR